MITARQRLLFLSRHERFPFEPEGSATNQAKQRLPNRIKKL